jgi:hypothetical protein
MQCVNISLQNPRFSTQWLWRVLSSGIKHCVVRSINRRFGGTYHLHLQCRMRRKRNQRERKSQAEIVSFYFLGWGETEYTWHVGHHLAYCTSPRWWMIMMSVEQSVEWLAGETEVLGENLPQCRFIHHKFHKIRPGLEPGPPRWEAGDYPPELWHGQADICFHTYGTGMFLRNVGWHSTDYFALYSRRWYSPMCSFFLKWSSALLSG